MDENSHKKGVSIVLGVTSKKGNFGGLGIKISLPNMINYFPVSGDSKQSKIPTPGGGGGRPF